MHSKACEGEFSHVIWFFLEMPRNSQSFNFDRCSVSNLVTCVFSKCPIFPFSELVISRKKHVTRFQTEQRPNLKLFEFWGISRKNQNAITWINWHAFWGISRYLPRISEELNLHPCFYTLVFSHRYYARFGKSDPRINQTVEEKQYSICDSSQQNRQTLPMANTSRNGMLSALDRPQFTAELQIH